MLSAKATSSTRISSTHLISCLPFSPSRLEFSPQDKSCGEREKWSRFTGVIHRCHPSLSLLHATIALPQDFLQGLICARSSARGVRRRLRPACHPTSERSSLNRRRRSLSPSRYINCLTPGRMSRGNPFLLSLTRLSHSHSHANPPSSPSQLSSRISRSLLPQTAVVRRAK